MTMKAVPTPPGCVTVPAVATVPPPQLMLAPPVRVVMSVSGAVGLASVKLATWPEKEFPSVALTAVPEADREGAPKVRIEDVGCVREGMWVTEIVTVYESASA